MNVIGNDKYLGGQLVGIGKVHRDGSEDFKWLGKPIHNRITSVGLDHLLCFNGQATGGIAFDRNHFSESQWANHPGQLVGRLHQYGKAFSTHYGAMTFCAIGSDGTETGFNDTELHAMIGSPFANHKFSSTAWFKGTKRNGFGNWIHRMTYTSNPVETDTTVREVGIFGRYGADDNPTYVLFARIVLDVPFELLAGESAIITYELHVNNYAGTAQYHDSFFGILDPDGNPLMYVQKLYRKPGYGTSNGCYYQIGEPSCGRGDGDDEYANASVASDNYYAAFWLPPYCYHPGATGSSDYGNGGMIALSTDSTKIFPGDYSNDESKLQFYNAHINAQYQFVDYEGVGTNDKHRDFKIIWGPQVPFPDEYTDFYYLRINGMDYRFGYLEEDGTTWHPQALRKYNNQTFTFTLRTAYHTEDTL